MTRECAWGNCSSGAWKSILWPNGKRLWYCPTHYEYERIIAGLTGYDEEPDVEGGDVDEY